MESEHIVLAHGGGGELTARLLKEHFLPRLGNPILAPLADSAVLDAVGPRIAFTIDAHVVQPLEFPGGDIGRLSVCGTVNDLAVMGAMPVALALAVVIEEGLPLAVLDRITDSIAAAAEEAGVRVVTGDTKVVERQRGDGLIITTAGLGYLRPDLDLGPARARPGDAIIISGPIAEHGLAVMSVREGLSLQTQLRSDVAPLNGLIATVLASGGRLRFMRDPTRGGLAGLLVDLSQASGLTVELHEKDIPLSATARHASELLGLDPLTVANEGKVVLVVAPEDASRVLETCRSHPLGREAAVIGRLVDRSPPLVELVTRAGGRRLVQRPYGEELPRIC